VRTLPRKLAKVKPGTVLVGVDLSLQHNVAVLIDAQGRQLDRFGFPHSRSGYDYFYGRLDAVCAKHGASEALVGMEPTNYFWKLMAADMEGHQRSYCLVNPYTVKKHREGDQLDTAKDDQRDAFFIADLVRTGKSTETQLQHGTYAELRQYVAEYERLRKDIRREKTRVHNMAGQLFPELTQVFKDLSCQTARAMLSHHAAAVNVQALPEEAFIAGVRADFQGKRLALSKLRRAHALAAGSVGLREGVKATQLGVRLHLEALQQLEAQCDEVAEQLVDAFLTLPEAKSLASVHGLGLITAATILAEVGDPSHFTNGSQTVKLAGIHPVPNTSGSKARSRTPMSHKGRPRLRTALFFAAMRLVQVDDDFARLYQHYRQRDKNPLLKMQALGAVMNKLMRILWALMRHQTLYQPGWFSRT
jgi:transposase